MLGFILITTACIVAAASVGVLVAVLAPVELEE